MVTEHTRKKVWQQVYDSAHLVRYYEDLLSSYRVKSKFVRLVLLVSAFGSIVTLLEQLPVFIQLVFNALIAIAVGCEFVFKYSDKAAILSTISTDCKSLDDKWNQLWSDVYTTDANDREILYRFDDLAQQKREITSRSNGAEIQKDSKLNVKSAQEARKVVEEHYVA